MSEIVSSESTSCVNEKPALSSRQNLLNNDVKFPPFPDPTEEEFEEDIGDEERTYYRNKFSDLDTVKTMRLHCSACDRHLGSSTRNESRMRAHPMLRTLVCHTCHTFYNSGEFEKGDDGSELYCRWCGQGGQVYCCSDCPHVFCAKCIKRNLGLQKIKEIENTDDWKCFKCNNKCLWDLRAVCWALLRYCDMKNKITYKTEDPVLKEAYQNDCSVDYAECCKYKSNRRKEKTEPTKKKEDTKKATATAISKIPSSIQVKKFACINLDEAKEKKPQKRPASQNDKVVFIKNPISIAPPPLNPLGLPPLKKPRIPVINPVRFAQQPERKPMNTYARIRPKLPTMPIPIIPTQFNGFNMNNNSFHNFGSMQVPNNDTLNLSLDSLTQGLDMVAVAAMASGTQDDDVVCTPDLPLEPLCEVMEDNTDDDVQCITPGPVAAPKVQTQPLLTRIENSLPDLSPDNIIQMTDNDVTVNAVTGGLKFRVDPQTLSSNKMYRLPDGRIFAIKANPNMPGGYSATIVAVTDTGVAKSAPKGATYAAKLSAVSSCQTSTPAKSNRSSSIGHGSNSKRNTSKSPKVTKGTDTSARECDLQVPVEWYRYNLVDAVDAVEYSLHRLYKLKKEATTRYLRTRSVEEMKNLHRTLDRLLNTSATRFNEIKENLNKELKQYIIKKTGGNVSDDDDDVEILPDLDDNDDPIFIDENSVESNSNDLTCNDSQEVDLTGVGSSDHNDSAEVLPENVTKNNKQDIDDNTNTENIKIPSDDISNNTDDNLKESSERQENHQDDEKVDKNDSNESSEQLPEKVNEESKIGEHDNPSSENKDGNIPENVKNGMEEETDEEKTLDTNEEKTLNGKTKQEKIDDDKKYEESKDDDKESNDENKESKDEDKESKDDEKKILSEDISSQDNDGKLEDSEMSEEMIETLLKDDNADEGESTLNNKSMEEVEGI